MIVNASLLRIDTRGMPDATGAESWTAGEALSIDCCVTEPSRAPSPMGLTRSSASSASHSAWACSARTRISNPSSPV